MQHNNLQLFYVANFYLFGLIAIASAVAFVTRKSPVSAALWLVSTMFALAAMYVMLDAPFIGVMQVLVYAGAIMVLFVFVIMLLNADVPSFDLGRSHIGLRGAAGVGCALMLLAFIWAFRNTPAAAFKGAFTNEKIIEAGGNTRVLSELMFSEYILPFELTSVLLLAGIVGAVAIAKRKF